jgi:hypothetical protein
MPKKFDSYWNVLEPHFTSINIYETPGTFSASIAAVPRYVVLLYAAHMCQSEVHNGGFLQLFWNSTGIIVPEAIEAYRTIGMPSLASLVERTAQPLGAPYPLDREDRWDALLQASGLSETQFEAILRSEKDLYTAFAKATQSLGFERLDREFWETAKAENGGFETAATRYAQDPFLIQ